MHYQMKKFGGNVVKHMKGYQEMHLALKFKCTLKEEETLDNLEELRENVDQRSSKSWEKETTEKEHYRKKRTMKTIFAMQHQLLIKRKFINLNVINALSNSC